MIPRPGTRVDDLARRDVPGLLEAARTLGHRPAVTLVTPAGRSGQGAASLAGWVAKGAHLLELELGPGDRLGVDAPPSWALAAVTLAAWWTGVVVVPAPDADVAVVHVGRPAPTGIARVLRLGDAFDGSDPGDPEASWTTLAMSMPDRPPAPSATEASVALSVDGHRWTQADLLTLARELAPDAGTIGLVATTERPTSVDGPALARVLAAVALRPFVSGRPTVVALDVDAAGASGEAVDRWEVAAV